MFKIGIGTGISSTPISMIKNMSAEASSVISKYPNALAAGEATAIAAFVDGCVSDNIWSVINDFGILTLSDEANSLKSGKLGLDGVMNSNSYHVPNSGVVSAAISNSGYDTGFIPSAQGIVLGNEHVGVYYHSVPPGVTTGNLLYAVLADGSQDTGVSYSMSANKWVGKIQNTSAGTNSAAEDDIYDNGMISIATLGGNKVIFKNGMFAASVPYGIVGVTDASYKLGQGPNSWNNLSATYGFWYSADATIGFNTTKLYNRTQTLMSALFALPGR